MKCVIDPHRERETTRRFKVGLAVNVLSNSSKAEGIYSSLATSSARSAFVRLS